MLRKKYRRKRGRFRSGRGRAGVAENNHEREPGTTRGTKHPLPTPRYEEEKEDK